MKKIFVKDKKKLRSDFQFFMHQFVDAAKRCGFESKCDFFPSYKFHIRSLLVRALRSYYRYRTMYFPSTVKRKKALLVATNADMLLPNAFPYFFYDIIPMYWDAWPLSWANILNHIKFFGCRVVFVSAKSVADMINTKTSNVHAYWIPEGIEASIYQKGENLDSRPFDVFEMGRKHPVYNGVLDKLNTKGALKGYLSSNTNSNGYLASSKKELTFPDYSDLVNAIPKYKVMVCFPQIDTNPERAGGVETLTQRYWEAMLSRCLMIGRAPQELIELIGYNPVVDVDWNNAENQLKMILNDISCYQGLVDKNFDYASKLASWDVRFQEIVKILKDEGYGTGIA